jgi:para-aminobenzoate synthetase component 1
MLEVRGAALRTSPIKGTRRRTGDEATDRAAVRELLASPKEAAELAMIVDLHRNDVGRVCQSGTVEVASPRRVEAHPTVFHTVADVVGSLRPECDAIDALAACFPAGSISGVPKIRALEIIHELEPTPRGAYCGAVGWLGLDGSATFNVGIRTVQFSGDQAVVHGGGGIVADSDPRAEYIETLDKIRGILRGLGVEGTLLDV